MNVHTSTNKLLSIRYVTIKRFAELTGYTEKAVREKIREGKWKPGKHFVRSPDNRIQMDMENYEKWLLGQDKQDK